ncbi:MAG TPA: WD40 repeat domain-containing protein, partial [Kofleriaceae bacterium]
RSPDGTRLLTAGGSAARLWNVDTLEQLGELVVPIEMRAATFSTDGTRIVTVSGDNLFRVWDATTQLELLAVEASTTAGGGHRAGGAWAALTDGEELIAGSGVDVRAWSMDRAPILAHEPTTTNWAMVTKPSPHDDAVVWADAGHAEIVRGHAITPLQIPKDDRLYWDAAWSPDATRVAVVGNGGYASIFDPATGELVHVLTSHEGAVNHVAFDRGGTRLVTAGSDHHAVIWDAATGTRLHDLQLTGPVLAATWSADGTMLATADFIGNLQVWDTRTWQERWRIVDPTSQFLDVAFSPDGTELATAGHDGLVIIWTLADHAKRTLVGHNGPCTTVAWSHDGKLIASSAETGGIRIWDPVTTRELARRGNGIPRLSFDWTHDDSKIVASGAGIDTFSVARDTHSIAELEQIRVPWKLSDGNLMPR